MLTSIVIFLSGSFLFLASVKDLQTGEIPERITRGFVASMVVLSSLSFIYSLNPVFLLEPLALGLLFFSIGYVMFYLGEWGGGDVKLLAGIGCSLGFLGSLGFFSSSQDIFPYPATYFINFALASGPYVIAYSLLLGLMKPRVFNDFISGVGKKISVFLIACSFIPAAASMYYGMDKLTLIYLLIPFLVIASIYLKSVERFALQKTVPVGELKEEDMVAEDIVVDGRKIASKRDADGLSAAQIAEIVRLASEGGLPGDVTIRWGVRFAPVFAFAYAMTLVAGDVLEVIVYVIMN